MSSQASTASADATSHYELKSDLAQYCLPAANQDEARKLAWINSICLLFLIIAAINLRQPVFLVREAKPPPDVLTAFIPPPVDQEPPPPDPNLQEEPTEAEDVIDLPVIAPVIVAAPQDVSFAVPVEGYIAIATDARFVPPPPPVIPKPPPPEERPRTPIRITGFGDKRFRKQPPPEYPPEFTRNRNGGMVEIVFSVGTNGVPIKADVIRGSGISAVDRRICDFILREWRTQPGEAATYQIPIIFNAP